MITERIRDLWLERRESPNPKGLTEELVGILKEHGEAYRRGEVPGQEWEQSVGGVMARGRWMREQLERADMGLPMEEFVLADWLEEVRADLARVAAQQSQET